jgi:hypothetical protein
MWLTCTPPPQMIHNHAIPRRIYTTADKLRVNKLSHASTHTFAVRLFSPHEGGFHFHMDYVPHGTTPRQQGGTPDGVS